MVHHIFSIGAAYDVCERCLARVDGLATSIECTGSFANTFANTAKLIAAARDRGYNDAVANAFALVDRVYRKPWAARASSECLRRLTIQISELARARS
jgi:hypothetical protein